MEPVRIHFTGEQPEGVNGVTPLGPEEKCPPPCSGPTDRAPAQAEWLPPRGAFKWRWVWAILGEGR
eukprot:6506208-Prymnesium_polylepis.1